MTLPIFPCKPTDKSPYTGRGFYDATTDEKQIKKWQREHPDAMWGVPTGEKSGWVVIDLDRKEGGSDGVATWEKLVAENGGSPHTRTHVTPSTGKHKIFKSRAGIKNIPLDKLWPGIEIKGEGGYIIIPPSRMADGREYTVECDAEPAELPDWVRARIEDYYFEQELNHDAGKGITREDDYEPSPTDIWKIKFALTVYTPNTRFIWLETAAGLYDEIGDVGWPLFLDWSRSYAKNFKGEKDCRKMWKEAAKFKSFHINTVFHYADEADPTWRDRYAAQQRGDKPGTPEDGGHHAQQENDVLLTSKEFVDGFIPPDYLIDGFLLRKYVYSLTGVTGSGKTAILLRIAAHVALGLPLGGMEVERGRVLYFAGENPTDVRIRWIKQCEELGVDPADMDVVFLDGPDDISPKGIRKKINSEAAKHGGFSLLIVDTSAAYFTGNDENDNVQAKNHAKMLRSFETLQGGPTILVSCHPTKNPDMNNLLPRGGGAFLNEVDGNLVTLFDAGTRTVEITTHGKFRGPEFSPFSFILVLGTSEKLKDRKGRLIRTVTAQPLTDTQKANIERTEYSIQNQLLVLMKVQPDLSLQEIADRIKSSKGKVRWSMNKLKEGKLVSNARGKWILTTKGATEADLLHKATTAPKQGDLGV